MTTQNQFVPPASQVDNQTIVGHPPVQARPLTAGTKPLKTNSISGQILTTLYDDKKGKGNN